MNEKRFNCNMKLVTLCQAAGRFDDMMNLLEQLAKDKKDDLNSDERNLISIAYKNVILQRRNALKIITNLEKKSTNVGLQGKSDKDHSKPLKEYDIDLIHEYKQRLLKEFIDTTASIAQKIESILLPKARDTEAKVFYNKLKGDYYRYIAENLNPNDRKKYLELSFKNYTEAAEYSSKLAAFNPIRLGLNLNFSVFYYELQQDTLTACKIASDTLNSVKKDLERIEEDEEETENYKDSLDVVELLKENLSLWKEGRKRKTSLVK